MKLFWKRASDRVASSIWPRDRDGDEQHAALHARLKWVTALRLGFITALLTILAVFYLGGRLIEYPVSLRVVFFSIAASYGLAGIYAAVLRGGRGLEMLAEAQVVCDQLLATVVVYVSGGPSSGATSLYALSCLTGAILIGLRGAILGALSSLTFYAALCAAFLLQWISPPIDQPHTVYATKFPVLIYPFSASAFGILLVSGLAGYLAERLRITGGELEAARQRAVQAERLAELGRIAAWLAHEIRNPLGSIRGSIEMLRESSGLSSEEKTLCDIVTRESTRLNELVSDMLDLSRPRHPEPKEVGLTKMTQEVISLAGAAADACHVALKWEGPTEPAIVRCDEAQMRQVVWNLVRNAIQASPEGTTVRLGVSRAEGGWELRIEDSGPGITQEDSARMFDAFYTKKRSHGAGIGLAVVKQIIDDHSKIGIEIQVRNVESEGRNGRPGGASFCIRFPAVSGSR